MTYFEKTYLQKNKSNISVKESKKLQKLLGKKAFSSGNDSKRLNAGDLKRMTQLKTKPSSYFNIENYIYPFDAV